ncbi:MAG: DUF3431 domain-containing protein [Lachnospiraceae bacterium]
MQKTDNFFLIHNYNTVPEELLKYCKEYLIVDCSDDTSIKKKLEDLQLHVKHIKNTGHNITTYFDFFVQQYEDLPEVICLLKGNMIGRHVSQEFFEQVYNHQYFYYLYDEKQYYDKYGKYKVDGTKNEIGSTFLTAENMYTELNNSWFVQSENHPKKYFNDTDDLMKFIYKNPMIPHYFTFSPGACYIIRKEQVLKHSKAFYRNLNKIMNYAMDPSFPSEAHQVERILPILFTSNCEVNEWMNGDDEEFQKKLQECIEYIEYKFENRPRRFKKLRQFLGLIK